MSFMDRMVQPSFIRELDFRTKLVWMAVIMIICLLWNAPLLQLGLFVMVLVLALAAKISGRYLTMVLGFMLPLAVFLVLMHGLFNIVQVQRLMDGEELTWLYRFPADWAIIGGRGATLEGLLYGVNVALKSLTLLLVLPLVVLTTDVDEMLAGLIQMRVPYVVAFILSSTIRFFPLLFSEAQGIIDAQRLRGLAVEKMNLLKRARIYAGTAVPLILSALMKSQQLEIALYSKAFSVTPKRSNYHEIKFRTRDWILMAWGTGLLAVVVFLYGQFGIGQFSGIW